MPLYTRVDLVTGEAVNTIPEDKWKTYQRVAEVYATQMDAPFFCEGDNGKRSSGNAGDYLVMSMTGDLSAVERDVFESLWAERREE